MKVDDILVKLPKYSEELGLDLRKPEDRFKWFLASILFARRISSEIAKRTFRKFVEEGLVTPDSILKAGWDRLVDVLDSGGYVRYDFSTASNLQEIMKELKEKYGSLEELHKLARDSRDLERRLLEFKGVGPICVNIFLRELRGIWEKAEPRPSKLAIEMGRSLGLDENKVKLYESALVRLKLEYCKRGRCKECPVRQFCKEKGS